MKGQVPKFEIWIDINKKVISLKEISNTKYVCFDDRDVGIQKVTEFVSKGYKIG